MLLFLIAIIIIFEFAIKAMIYDTSLDRDSFFLEITDPVIFWIVPFGWLYLTIRNNIIEINERNKDNE